MFFASYSSSNGSCLKKCVAAMIMPRNRMNHKIKVFFIIFPSAFVKIIKKYP